MTQVAWIGLGNMGRGMCANLVSKGNLSKPLIIYNRTVKRSEDLVSKLSEKVTIASSVEDAVSKSDIIFTCVGDDKAINATINTALTQDVSGKLFVDCSTVHPTTTEGLAAKITGKGAEFVAAPVFGAPAMADSGALIFILAGPANSVEKVKPFTTGVMGRAIIDFSSQPCSKATLLKIIGNTFIMNMIETLSEGHVLAEATGLGGAQLHQFIEAMFPGPYVAYSNRMMGGDYYQREEPLFQVDLALKDVNHALNLAGENGVSMKNLENIKGHLEVVKEEQGEKGDVAGIYGTVRKESGLQFGNK